MSGTGESASVTITMTQNMVASYLQYLQVQTQAGKLKMDYMKRRDEREEKESIQRREAERLRIEREANVHDKMMHDSLMKSRTDKALVSQFLPAFTCCVEPSVCRRFWGTRRWIPV
jgi:histone acetyltransferase MYST4